MSTFPCKIISEHGVFFALINDTADQFVSPAFASIANLAFYANESYDTTSIVEWFDFAENTACVYQLKRLAIFKAVACLAKMKTGRGLTDNEARSLYEFHSFLRLTVADHQYDYDEISKEVVEKWIDELKIRQEYFTEENHESIDYWDILDSAMWKTFQERGNNLKHVTSDNAKDSRSNLEKLNKLVGRYISRMAIIAKIAGTGKRTLTDIINHFRYKSLTSDKVQVIMRKLKKKKVCERPHILLGVYKQLVISNKRRQSNGEYRRLINDNYEEGIELIIYLIGKLLEFGLDNHANRLKEQYL